MHEMAILMFYKAKSVHASVFALSYLQTEGRLANVTYLKKKIYK